MILLLIGHCPRLRSNAPLLIISATRGGVSLAGSASGPPDDLLRLAWVWAVEHSPVDGWLRRVLLPVFRVAEGILEEPHDRVLRHGNDLMYLRRDQAGAVEEILGDLGPYAVPAQRLGGKTPTRPGPTSRGHVTDARPTHGIRKSRRTPVGTPGAAVMDRSCGAEGRATARERCYAEALRGSRAARTRSRPKMNSSAGS